MKFMENFYFTKKRQRVPYLKYPFFRLFFLFFFKKNKNIFFWRFLKYQRANRHLLLAFDFFSNFFPLFIPKLFAKKNKKKYGQKTESMKPLPLKIKK